MLLQGIIRTIMRKCTAIVKRISFVLLVISGLMFSQSCRPTQIYNPSLNLPSKPLEKGDISISGNVLLAPESRPDRSVDQSKVSPAGNVSVVLALTDQIAIQAEGLLDLSESYNAERGGVAFSMFINLNQKDKDSPVSWVLIPKYGFAMESKLIGNGLQVPGYGFSLSLAGWMKTNSLRFKPYFGVSTIYGFADWDHEKLASQATGDNRIRSGFAFGLHGGLNYELNKWANLSVELPIIYQYNYFEGSHYIIPVPSLGIKFDLEVSKK